MLVSLHYLLFLQMFMFSTWLQPVRSDGDSVIPTFSFLSWPPGVKSALPFVSPHKGLKIELKCEVFVCLFLTLIRKTSFFHNC